MSSNFSGVNPLSYIGVTPATPAPVIIQTRAPTPDDIQNFSLSTIWLDKDAETAYMLVNKEVGVAAWLELGGSTGGVDTLTTPDATVVVPTAGNINFLNGSSISITGAGSAVTVNSDAISTVTTPDTTIVGPTAGNINFLNGSGLAITGAGDNITFTATAPPFSIQWSVITTPTFPLVVNQGFVANAGGGVVFTLPAVCSVGDVIFVNGVNAGGWTIAQNALQSIRMGNLETTVGVGGSLASTDVGDSIALVCYVDNTSFTATSSMGNITVT